MDLSHLSDDELKQIAGAEVPASQTSAEAMPDLSHLSDEELHQIAGTGLETGSLRRGDEAVIQAGGLDTPEGQAKVEQNSQMLAAARPFLDYAIPGGGQAGREAEAKLIEREYASKKIPVTHEEALAMSDKRQQSREAAYPMTSLASKGLGLVTAGAAVNPGVGAIRTSLGKTISPELAEIGAMSGLGALENVMGNRSNPNQDVLEDAVNGALVTGMVTSLLHAPTLTRTGLNKVNDVFVQAKRNQISREISDLDEIGKLQQKASGLKQQDLKTYETKIEKATSNLDALKVARQEADDFINQNPTVSMELYQLPDTIKGTFDTSLQNVASVKNQRLQALANQRVNLDAPYESLVTSIEKFKPATEEAIKAKREVLQAAKNFEDSITVEDLPIADPILGKTGQTKRARSASVLEADAAKQQLQDMLYEREFYKNAPKEVKSAMTKFERSVREQINQMDPTGELAAANNTYHGLKVAQRDMDDHVSQALFARKATGNEDAWNVNGILGTTFDYLETPQALKQKGSKVETALDDKILGFPALRDEVNSLKLNLKTQIDDVTNRYGRYQEAKKLSANFTKDSQRLEEAIDRTNRNLSDAKLASEYQGIDKKKLQGQKASLAKTSRDLTALDALAEIPVLGPLMSKIVKRPSRLMNTVGRRQVRALGRKIPQPASLAARGASFQTPELIMDAEQGLDEE